MEFRAYFIEADGGVRSDARISAGTDAEAIGKAQALRDGCRLDLWQVSCGIRDWDRLVCRFKVGYPRSQRPGPRK